jgi:methenyltetrahydromethanopterin cyclohydrolase
MRKVFIDCPEDIPCNPCESSCPAGAITIPGSLTAKPIADIEKCTGCAKCVAACPGQACFVIDPDYNDNEASVDFPYEYLPLPPKGLLVAAMNNLGERVCQGRVVQVLSPKDAQNTSIVRIAVPKDKAYMVRGMMPPELDAGRFSLNNNARELLEKKVIPNAEKLRIGIREISNGATVIDMGVRYPGGFLAGKYFTEACLGGMGRLSMGKMRLAPHLVPSVKINVSMPEISEMASHVAALRIPWKGKTAVLSGPGRSIRGADHFASAVSYRDRETDCAVFCIQTEDLPDEELTGLIAEETGIKPEGIYIIAARTGCIVGAIQVCARNVEQVLPTLHDRGFPMEFIVEANGITPLISITDDEKTAWGRVNDCLIYGQETNLYVRCDDAAITSMLADIPFSKNKDIYGTPFYDLFEQCQWQWANVPRDWDAPCKVNFINMKSGNIFSTGHIGYETLERSFMGNGEVLV